LSVAGLSMSRLSMARLGWLGWLWWLSRLCLGGSDESRRSDCDWWHNNGSRGLLCRGGSLSWLLSRGGSLGWFLSCSNRSRGWGRWRSPSRWGVLWPSGPGGSVRRRCGLVHAIDFVDDRNLSINPLAD